jgi:hypothetical protein
VLGRLSTGKAKGAGVPQRALKSRLLEATAALCAVSGVAILLILPCFFGKTPANTSPLFLCAPWEELRPDNLGRTPDPLSNEAVQRYLPWYIFMNACVKSDDSLLWNPLEYSGVPFYALWRTRCLSPFSAPFYILPLHTALSISLLMKLIAGGFCAYYAARKLGMGAIFAFTTAVTFQCSSIFLLWPLWPVSDAAPWAPLLLVFVDRVNFGLRRLWPIGAFIFGLILFSSDAETGLALFTIAMCFCAVWNVRTGGSIGALARSLTTVIASFAVAILIASVQVLPFIEFLRHASMRIEQTPSTVVGFTQLIVVALPYFFGKPPAIYDQDESSLSFQAQSLLYPGITIVLLLPLWIALRKWAMPGHAKRIDTLFITAGAALFAGIAVPHVVPFIPGVLEIGPQHFLLINAFLFPFIAVAAAEHWLMLDPEECKGTIGRLMISWAALACAVTVLFVASHGSYRPSAPSFIAQFGGILPWILGVLILLTLTLFRPSNKVMATGLLLTITPDLLLTFYPSTQFSPPEQLFPETSFVSLLKSRNTRVGGKSALGAWPLAGNLVPQMYGSSGIRLARYDAFITKLEERPMLLRRGGSETLLLNKEDIQGAFANARPILRLDRVLESGAVLFTDLEMQSRLRLNYEGRAVPAFLPDDLDPDAPPLIEVTQPFSATPGPPGSVVQQETETNTRIVVKVNQSHAGILVLADAWYPGWSARIDNQPADVFPVDGAFRGVVVEAGTHTVEFVYTPRSFQIGIWITALSTAFLGAAIIRLLRVGLRQPQR